MMLIPILVGTNFAMFMDSFVVYRVETSVSAPYIISTWLDTPLLWKHLPTHFNMQISLLNYKSHKQ